MYAKSGIFSSNVEGSAEPLYDPMLIVFGVTVAVCAALLLFPAPSPLQGDHQDLLGCILSLALVAAARFRHVKRVATGALITGLCAAVLTAAWLDPTRNIAVFCFIPLILALGMLGVRWALGLTLGCTLCVLLLPLGSPFPALIAVWGSLWVGWMVIYPVQVAIADAEARSDQARAL